MNARDAQEIVRMIESNWHFDLGPARSMWLSELMMWDAELTMKALAQLARRQAYKIVLADLVETLEMLNRKIQSDAREKARQEADAKAIETGRRGYAPPEWVLVWAWDRNRKVALWEKNQVPYKDRELRSLPQQGDWTDPYNTMSMEEYESLRSEWREAGSPKVKIPVVEEV